MRSLSILCFAAGVAGRVGSIQDYAVAIQNKDARSVMATAGDLSNFEFYVQHAGAAYCNSDAAPGTFISCGDGVCPDVESDNATIIGTFSGLVTGIAGYVAADTIRNEIVLSIRGSTNIRNFLTDLFFKLQDCSDLAPSCQAHAGFLDAWDDISPVAMAAVSSALAAHPGFRLVVAGHSLGAAVATLAAAHLRRDGFPCDVYTFGSPRVGNLAFVEFVDGQRGVEYRVTHTDDPVPRLPPIFFGYSHTSPEFWLSKELGPGLTYPLSDVVVCEGNDDIGCNGGTLGFDVGAHLEYFVPVTSCGAMPLSLRRDVIDQDLASRLDRWGRSDQDLARARRNMRV